MNDAPKLLVEWSSPWREFLTAIRPALGRSPTRLAGEARSGLFPYRGMLASWVLEAALLAAVIILPTRLAFMHPYQPPPMPKYDVIYFSGDELPQTQDVGGARAGRAGRAGGKQAYHRTQTIRVARGDTLREQVVDAPRLKLPQSNSAVANLLAYKSLPGPAPTEGLRPSNRSLSQNQEVVPPTPEIERQRMQAMTAFAAPVVPPAASAPQRDFAEVHLPGSHAMEVIPPPVSAPEEITNTNPKLTLPAPSVIAPPPTQVSRDMRTIGPGFGSGELQKQIVPPPVATGGSATGQRSFGGVSGPAVVPPPVQVGGGSSQDRRVAGLGGGNAVVPPPPSTLGGGAISGMGRGNRGTGLGGPMDAGSVAAPPSNGGGSGGGTGIVVSSQPGSKIGVPGSGGSGSLAMSPSGGSEPGLGGSGGGSGIGHGNGPGAALSGEGPGAAKEGSGRGSDVMANGGISPYAGPGGAGNGSTGHPAMPGVSVQGGSNSITLPSFDSGANAPSVPGRSSTDKNRHGPDITIVATSRSGGAFNFYGALKGDKVYTIYIDTTLGTAVMQYADPASAAHPYAEDLSAPEPMRADLPRNLKRARLVIACLLDRSGMLRNPHVLEPGGAELTAKVLAALPSWKFRPAMRGDIPVEVNALLGFGIDTR